MQLSSDVLNYDIKNTAEPFLLFFWHLFLVISSPVSASLAFLSLHSLVHCSEESGPVAVHRCSTVCLSYSLCRLIYTLDFIKAYLLDHRTV